MRPGRSAAGALVLLALALAAARPSAPAASATAADEAVALAGASDVTQDAYDRVRTAEETLAADDPAAPCRRAHATALAAIVARRRQLEFADRDPDDVDGGRSLAALEHGRALGERSRFTAAPGCTSPPAAAGRAPRVVLLADARGVSVDPAASSAVVVVDGSVVTRVPARAGRVDLATLALPAGLHAVALRPADAAGSALPAPAALRVLALPAAAQSPSPRRLRDATLSRRFAAIAASSGGEIGIYAWAPATGAEACFAAARSFPAASTLKLGIAAAALTASPADGGILHDVAAIGAWSSNGAATRLEEQVGDARIMAALGALGASRSTYGGTYQIGTAAPAPGACAADHAGERAASRATSKWTTAVDLGNVLASIDAAATRREDVPLRHAAAVELLAALAGGEHTGDNRGIVSPFVPRSMLVAEKNGWLTGLFHSAAIVFSPNGPRVVVVLTSGLDRTRAEGVGHAVVRAVLAGDPLGRRPSAETGA